MSPPQFQSCAAFDAGDSRSSSPNDLPVGAMLAAADLLEEGGPDAVTLRAVGARAGVSRSAPYRHFTGKPPRKPLGTSPPATRIASPRS